MRYPWYILKEFVPIRWHYIETFYSPSRPRGRPSCLCPHHKGAYTQFIYKLCIYCIAVYTHKPKPIVSSDAQIVPLPSWLLSLAWNQLSTSIEIYSSNFGFACILSLCFGPFKGRCRSDCSGMPGSRKWPWPGLHLPRESRRWCGSWPATSWNSQGIRHTQPLTDPRRLGRYVHAPPAVQWVQRKKN